MTRQNVHAIGDRANGIVLDAFEEALKEANVSALRPRLEHAQILSQADMARFGKLGGTCPSRGLSSWQRLIFTQSLLVSSLHMRSWSTLPSVPQDTEIQLQNGRYVVRRRAPGELHTVLDD